MANPVSPLKVAGRSRAEEPGFRLYYFVGSQDFSRNDNFWKWLKKHVAQQIKFWYAKYKKHKVLEDEQKCIQRRLTEGMGISKLENNSFLFPQLFFDTSSIFREGSCDHIQLLTIRWLERANVVWHGTHVWLTCDLCPEMKLFCRVFFTSMEGEVFQSLAKASQIF